MKFEDYIRHIRPQLDIEYPNEDHIWDSISQSIKIHVKKKRMHNLCYSLLLSAMIVIAFIAGYHITKISKHPREVFLLYQEFTTSDAKQKICYLYNVSF